MGLKVFFGFLVLFLSSTVYIIFRPPPYPDSDYYIFRNHFPKGEGKTISIFISDGQIGFSAIKHAIAHDFSVVAYVRNASELRYHHKRLQVVQGSFEDVNLMRKSIRNSSAIVSTLEPSMNFFGGSEKLADANRAIIMAAKAEHVKRFICLGTPAIRFYKDMGRFFLSIPIFFHKLLNRGSFKDIGELGEDVKNSGLDWTIVRFGGISDNPARSKVLLTYGENKFGTKISREDVAIFCICAISADQFIHDMPILGW